MTTGRYTHLWKMKMDIYRTSRRFMRDEDGDGCKQVQIHRKVSQLEQIVMVILMTRHQITHMVCGFG